MAPILSVALLAAIPQARIDGGTPGQRAQLRGILAQVPDCLRNADGTPVDVHIVGGTGHDQESEESRHEINAEYDEADPKHHQPRGVWVNQALFEPNYTPDVREAAAEMCSDMATMRAAMNPVAMLTHEFAHHFQLGGTYVDSQGKTRRNADRIRDFLAIKWKKARTAALHDREVKRLTAAIAKIESMRPPRGRNAAAIMAKREAARCALVKQLDARMASYGFPVRFPGDGPYTASDRDGAEYFAVAIETLIYHPDVFRKAYSPQEQKWLSQNIGECIGTFPHRAPSYDAIAGATHGNGRRDAAGVHH